VFPPDTRGAVKTAWYLGNGAVSRSRSQGARSSSRNAPAGAALTRVAVGPEPTVTVKGAGKGITKASSTFTAFGA